MSLNSFNIRSRTDNSEREFAVKADPLRSRGRGRKCPFDVALRLLSLAAIVAVSAYGQAKHGGSSEIVGSVHDGSGDPVAEASVRLQAQGEGRAEERKTDTSGSFGFSGLASGTYLLTASKGERHSNEITVSLMRAGAIQHVDLTLANSTSPGSHDKDQKAEMEFSDAPNFTVAAVTDWTAAGGHGSDTSLRTSEALTRETLRLKPDSTSPGSHEHDESQTEQTLRFALGNSPRDFKANEALGRFYLENERYSDAVAPLETAYEIDDRNQENEYGLTLALARSGNLASAREHVIRLLASGDRPEWHRLAGEVDERSGDPLGAVREFERAAKADPSEENYFAWGSELLEHRAIWEAKDVFESGIKAYPNSTRMLTALGAALFGAALYEEAARRLCEASDLKPSDPEPYLFMGKVEIAAPNSLPCIENRLERFAKSQPANPLANYYFGMAYWKEHGKRSDAQTLKYVENYLNKAVEADRRCSSAYLQLGVLQASSGDYDKAAQFYRKAIDAEPESTEAHYRLGVAYDRLGEKQKAANEFRLHDQLEKQHAALVDRQRREVKQFVVRMSGDTHDRPTPP